MSRTEAITVYSNVNLVADAEQRQVGEKTLTSFRFADNSSSDKDETMWVTATLSGKLGEIAADLKKGDRVNVSGKLTLRVYDKKDGSQGLSFELKYPTTFSVNTRQAQGDADAGETEAEPAKEETAAAPKRRGRPPKSASADLPY